jgi:hypothetical protein
MSDESASESPRSPTTAPSSPPDIGQTNGVDMGLMLDVDEVKRLQEEEKKAHAQNEREEIKRRKALAMKRKKTREESAEERALKAKQLDSLLAKSAVCSTK